MIVVNAEESDTIYHLNAQIEDLKGISIREQCVIYGMPSTI